jgi:hypothetical protein
MTGSSFATTLLDTTVEPSEEKKEDEGSESEKSEQE